MVSEVQGAFANYYEVLSVAEDASTQEIRTALDKYCESLREQMNNPFSMRPARSAMNEIVPAIERFLLDDNTRLEYDRQLAASRMKQIAQYEPADDEGLDDPLRIPFLFNPLEDFDTEIPGHTLRLIAMKLDTEWAEARRWITDTSDEIHSFVSYLTFVANRRRLAERIGQIIEAVSRTTAQRMNMNEGIERCINILNPNVERPRVGIYNPTFDGRTFDAGTFISDLPARSELVLAQEGVRGCAFGVIESRTNWLTFTNGQSKIRFALMPEGTEPEIGASEVKIPLSFKVGNLTRNADHSAILVLRMENQVNDVEQAIQVVIHVRPLPPRVVFEPVATAETPAWAGMTRRGVPTSIVVAPRNHGDEELIPLVARIATNDQAASVRPGQFHANEPITLAVDTSNRTFGQKYTIPFAIDYMTAGALGPTTIYVQGETLPTAWQSMLREKGLRERVGTGCAVGLAGWLLLGTLGLAAHANFAWLLFLTIPILFALLTRSIVSTTVAHMQRSGATNARIEHITPWMLWGIPIAIGLVAALVCTLLPDGGSAFSIGGFIGFMVGGAFGFMLDKTKAAKTNTANQY